MIWYPRDRRKDRWSKKGSGIIISTLGIEEDFDHEEEDEDIGGNVKLCAPLTSFFLGGTSGTPKSVRFFCTV